MINAHELEKDLIDPSEWSKYYDQMPVECKKEIAVPDDGPIGVGKNEKVGWFVLGCGQGPFVIWTEKEEK